MNEFLSSSRDITYSKYSRLVVIACLDTLFNLPVLITVIITGILQGEDSPLNYPYISWKSVHNGADGNLPGLSLSSILQTPASEWSTNRWEVFVLKWDEWGLRPPCDNLLWRVRYNSRDATTLPIRILVRTGATWAQKASRVRSGDTFGRRIQL